MSSADDSPSRKPLPGDRTGLESLAAKAREAAERARGCADQGVFTPVDPATGRADRGATGGPAWVVAPGELLELSRELAPYGPPELEPVECPALLHRDGASVEFEAKLRRVDGEALVSGPPPRCVVARVQVEVLRDAANKLTKVIEQNLRDTPCANAEEPSPLRAGFLSASDLAGRYGVDKERLRKALERWRQKDFGSGWHEVSERKPREPRYFYDPAAVEDVIASVRAK